MIYITFYTVWRVRKKVPNDSYVKVEFKMEIWLYFKLTTYVKTCEIQIRQYLEGNIQS